MTFLIVTLCARCSTAWNLSRSQKAATGTPNATGKIAPLRGQLLQAARKVAESGRTGWPAKFGDVIAHATEGKVTLDQLKNLTDTDATVIEAALVRLTS